jgi:hypothetical protein
MSQYQKSAYAPCPSCGAEEAKKVPFTFWGGFIGPAPLTHVRCPHCGTAYNRKTGRSNTGAIVIYFVVILGVFIALGILVAVLNAH